MITTFNHLSVLFLCVSYSTEGTPSKDGTVVKRAISDYHDIDVEADYKGCHLTFPLTIKNIQELIESFKNGRLLHAKYILQVLDETRKLLKDKPNINQATTAIAKQITVCGKYTPYSTH